MIRDIVNSIILNIAKQYPLQDNRRQINMYAFMNEGKVLTSPTMDKAYIDYVNGLFWARDWEQEGADPSTLRREYPFMTLENVSISKDSFSDKQEQYEFWVLIGDQLQCAGCPERSETDIYSELYTKASNVMMELSQTYSWTDGENIVYATKKYVDYWQSKGELIGYNKGTKILSDSIERIKINASNLNLPDGVISVAFSFTVCSKLDSVEFNYEPTVPSNLIGMVKCDTC